MANKKYYSFYQEGTVADIRIDGHITSWPWIESDVSAYSLTRQIEALDNVDQINVHINSYGGEVAEGLAIYNALKRHKAKVVTTCDGFACSIASVIFMAGDERLMCDSSLLMIHPVSGGGFGTATEHRKDADDLDTINEESKKTYLAHVNITEEELTEMMEAQSWIGSEDAVKMGFATGIEPFDSNAPTQSARKFVYQCIMNHTTQESNPGTISDICEKMAAAVSAAVAAAVPRESEPAQADPPLKPIVAKPANELEVQDQAINQLSRFISFGLKKEDQ